jgi:hypothetical protein
MKIPEQRWIFSKMELAAPRRLGSPSKAWAYSGSNQSCPATEPSGHWNVTCLLSPEAGLAGLSRLCMAVTVQRVFVPGNAGMALGSWRKTRMRSCKE